MEERGVEIDVSDYFPYIIKIVSEVTGRYVEVENSIELSIALEKFVDVDRHYDPSKGPFMPYLKRAVRNALIDYMKSESRKKTVSTEISVEQPSREGSIYSKAQLDLYEKALAPYKINFEKLSEMAPIHKKTRGRLLVLCRELVTDEQVIHHLLVKRRLPIKMIAEKYDVGIKVVKSHKLYIIAIIVAYIENVDLVIDWVEAQ